MADTVETGVFTSSLLPLSYRTYYETVLLDVLRTGTIYQGYAKPIIDFAARDTKEIKFTEVWDLHPSIGALTEAVPFVEGAFLDGQQFSMTIQEYGNVVKTNRFHSLTQFWNSGEFESLVREKLGRNLVETLEILARNEFLNTSHVWYSNASGGTQAASRATLAADDVLTRDYADWSRVNLQSRDALGLNDGANSVVAIVHPRQALDLRKAAGSDWQDVMLYAAPGQVLRGEVGMLDGVRYVQNNFARLPNAGASTVQSTLSAGSVKGQGGPDSDLRSGGLEYVAVTDTTGFAAKMEVTIHKASLGTTVLETDATAETRVIKTVESGKLYFTQPLFLAHDSGSYVTEAPDIYATVVIGGPGLLWGVAAMPTIIVPPVIDDYGRINRVSWYGIFDFKLLRDPYIEVWYTRALTANHGAA